MIPALTFIPLEEAKAIVALPKFISGNIEWRNSPTNSHFFVANFVVFDEGSKSMPGLTLDFVYRSGVVPDECNYKFTLYKFSGSRRYRVFQIEVYPWEKQSHTDGLFKHYGPHQHFGEQFETILGVNHLDCKYHQEWFNEFLKRGNITFSGKYFHPDPQYDLGV
jgi:hypothetical protein